MTISLRTNKGTRAQSSKLHNLLGAAERGLHKTIFLLDGLGHKSSAKVMSTHSSEVGSAELGRGE